MRRFASILARMTGLAGLGKLLAIAMLCLIPFALPVRAETPVPPVSSESAEGFNWQDYQEPPVKRAEENPFISGLSFLLKFGAVVGMIYGTAWLYRRGLISRGSLATSPETGLRVIESVPLRGAQTLHVVEIGHRTLVVGSNGKETMVKLAEWEGPAPRFATAMEDAVTGEPEPFSRALDETLRRVSRQEQA